MTPLTVQFRKATLDDLALLERWDDEPHVVESDPNDDWGWEDELGRDPDWREQWIAEVNATPIGFVEIIDPAREESQYWGPCPEGLRAVDIWIGEAAYLGRGFGTQMMTQAIEHCFGDPSVQLILIDPLSKNERARRFYERLGFRFVEYRQFDLDHCAVYALTRPAWQQEPAAAVDFSIRAATAADCAAATELCLRSKASWGYSDEFMAACRPILTVDPQRLEEWTVRVAENSKHDVLGVVAFSIDEEPPKEAELELMFVEPRAMGSGVGKRLMADALAALAERGVETLWILADPGAEPFYIRCGAKRVSLRPSDAIPGRQLPWLRLDVTAASG